jgi:hypothetical protein
MYIYIYSIDYWIQRGSLTWNQCLQYHERSRRPYQCILILKFLRAAGPPFQPVSQFAAVCTLFFPPPISRIDNRFNLKQFSSLNSVKCRTERIAVSCIRCVASVMGEYKIPYVLYTTNIRVLIIKPTRCTNFSNLFWNETLHVSDSSSVHHQELFTVHSVMVYVIQPEHMLLLKSCLQTCMTYTIAECTGNNSWRWTEELPETCRI